MSGTLGIKGTRETTGQGGRGGGDKYSSLCAEAFGCRFVIRKEEGRTQL